MRIWRGDGLEWRKREAGVADEIRIECRFLTPVMGGGVTPKRPDDRAPVRVPSIRGQLRFWWRATHRDLDLETLRRRETELFGGVSGTPTASAVSVRVVRPPRPGRALEGFQRGNAFALAHGASAAIAYGAFPLRGVDAAKTHDVLFEYDDTFEIGLRVRDGSLRGEVERAMWAWLHFGGLGARTRRGFGAVALVGSATGFKLRSIEDGWPNAGALAEAAWPVLGVKPGSVARTSRTHDRGIAAQEELLTLLREMRQGRIGRNEGQQQGRPGRSRWPEPDAIRRTYGLTGGRHGTPIHAPAIDAFPRSAFGAPIIFHFKTEAGEREPPDTTLVPAPQRGDPYGRFASQLVLRPHQEPGGAIRALALRLDHPRPDRWVLLERTRVKGTVETVVSAAQAAQIKPLQGTDGSAARDAAAAYLERLKSL